VLILSVALIFSAIFAMLHFENKPIFFEPHMKDLIQSIAMYARVFGHLPQHNATSNQEEIPWQQIGISQSFFQTYIQYKPNKKMLDRSLTPMDLKLFRIQKYFYTQQRNIQNDYYDPNAFAISVMPCTSIETATLDACKRHSLAYLNSGNDNITAFILSAKLLNEKIAINIDIETLCEYANYPLYIARFDAHIAGMPIYLVDNERTMFYLLTYY